MNSWTDFLIICKDDELAMELEVDENNAINMTLYLRDDKQHRFKLIANRRTYGGIVDSIGAMIKDMDISKERPISEVPLAKAD